jgi:anti-anti-sigma regulatory factor
MSAIGLPEELTIYNASATAALFDARLAQGGDLELDAASVVEVDTAGIQLLLAARRHAAALQRGFSLCNVPAALESAFALLELSFDAAPEAGA